MIWLQINESAGDAISLDDVEQIVYDVPIGTADREFADRLYRRDRDGDDDDEWPTLSNLIRNEQQILFFYMGGPDGREESRIGIHYFYEYGMSTDWSYASVSELSETALNGCKIQRDSSYRRDFFMMNTFVTKKVFGVQMRPSRGAAKDVNEGTFLHPLVDYCERTQMTKVNIISIDFWKSGNLVSYIDDHNSELALANIQKASTSVSAYLPPSDQPTSVQDYSYQVPSFNDIDSISSTASRPWSDSERLPYDGGSSRTVVPSYDGDIASIPATASMPWSDSEKLPYDSGSPRTIHRDNKTQPTYTPDGDQAVGPSSEPSSTTDMNKTTYNSLAPNSDPQGYSWSQQPTDEKNTEQASTSALMVGDGNMYINIDSAAAISNRFTWAHLIGIVLVITSTVFNF